MTDSGKRLIGGRYEPLRSVDEGGSSYIFLVRDVETDKRFAMKLLKPELFSDKAYGKAFKKEINVLKKLNHPGIIHMVDHAQQGSFCYYIMDYLPGKTLKSHIEKGDLTLEQKLNIALKLCDAMEYAHGAGVVHCDLKPANVVLNEAMEPTILDFGTAETQEAEGASDVFGTAEYISPEQAKGEKTDKYTDLYSMGVLFYELFTGTLPFTGEDAVSVALKHIHQELPDPAAAAPDLPQSMVRILQRALQKQKADRYTSFAKLRKDLEQMLVQPDGAYVQLPQPRPQPRRAARQRAPRRRFGTAAIVMVAVLAVVAVLGALGIFVLRKDEGVYMPSLQNKTVSEANAICQQYKLELQCSYVVDDQAEVGKIISHTPSAGEVIQPGTVVQAVVNLGVGNRTEMPALLGEDEARAKDWLAQLGFDDVRVEYVYEQGAADGQVVVQYPEAGVQVPLDETVMLSINRSGSQMAEQIPNLIGMDLFDAAAEAQTAGFTHIRVEVIDMQSSPGQVITQYPTSDMTEVSLDVMEIGVQASSSAWQCKPEIPAGAFGYAQDAYVTTVITFEYQGIPYEFVMEKYTCKTEMEFAADFGQGKTYRLQLDEKFQGLEYTVCIYLNGEVVYTKPYIP